MRRFDQINVIPFIDIMLVLLAIVLTTASFISTGLIEIDLPSAEHARPTLDNDPTEITIDENNAFYLGSASVTLEVLSERLSVLDKTTPVVLRVDKSVRFEHFIEVVDLLKKHQLDKLSIISRNAHAAS